jgi:ubiquinol-cytochrome c reductase cytochrome c subunit
MQSAKCKVNILLPIAAVLATAVISIAAAQAQTTPAAPAPAAPAGNADTGKKLFVSVGCYQCHGYEGQGGSAGPRLAPRPLPYAGFSRYVRRPTNQMPPYTERLVPDADLAHIYAYLQSRPAPPPVSGIPLLQ